MGMPFLISLIFAIMIPYTFLQTFMYCLFPKYLWKLVNQLCLHLPSLYIGLVPCGLEIGIRYPGVARSVDSQSGTLWQCCVVPCALQEALYLIKLDFYCHYNEAKKTILFCPFRQLQDLGRSVVFFFFFFSVGPVQCLRLCCYCIEADILSTARLKFWLILPHFCNMKLSFTITEFKKTPDFPIFGSVGKR